MNDQFFSISSDIHLRPWKDDDAESLVVHANNKAIARNMTNQFPHPFTPENAAAFIHRANASVPPTILAISVNHVAVGGIGIHPQPDIYERNAELGYWLGESFWGKGIATEAVTHMLRYGFDHWPVERIYARPYGSNIGSQKVLEKAGFILEARLAGTIYKWGVTEDELIYSVRRTTPFLK